LGQPFDVKSNPLPWMNNYLSSDNVQVAPQESEISSYLVGQIDSEVSAEDFGDFDL
jgi:ribonucleoside-diphosphate reductase beta chain